MASVGAGAALGLAPQLAAAAPADDRTLLRLNLELEQVVALAYELALSSGRLDRRRQATATAILAQERAHAQALSAFLRELGAPVPSPPRDVAAVDAVVPGLDRATTQSAVLSVLAELERLSVYGYYLGIQRLYDQKLVQTATAVLGDEAQHLTALRTDLGRDPLPAPFEVGARPVTSAPNAGARSVR